MIKINCDYKIRKSKNLADIFEIVKGLVWKSLGRDQAGVMVGVSDLGALENGFIGAFYSLNSNMIIINKRPLMQILQTNPSIYKFYLFHVMLHEYIHSIGFYDESTARQLVYSISDFYFGESHLITQLAANIEKFIPYISYPDAGFKEPEDTSIEFIKGIDRKNTNYIN